MKVVRTIEELRSALDPERHAPRSIGFVPTMGALHEGHLSLIDAARAETDLVVVSIFVNPLQFGPSEDLASYPRDEAGDLERASGHGADVVFIPSVDEMYPSHGQRALARAANNKWRSTTVSVGELATVVEGAKRPGHFDGVATVVAKLFNIVSPDAAFFGQKDAQQVAVIKKMVRDLSMSTRVVVRPTVREDDGLAMSSRNVYLDAAQRARATVLHRALRAGAAALAETRDPRGAEKVMLDLLDTSEGIEVDYAVVVDPDSFGPPLPGSDHLLAVAARLGSTRLIDNVLVTGNELEG